MQRILLIEDDPDMRPLVEHVLRDDGYAVHVAITAASARALLDANSYDLVVADGVLPDGDGIDIADEAKRRGVKTIVMTGYAFRTPMQRLARHEYLMKPVGLPELLGAVYLTIGRAMQGGMRSI